MAAQQRRLLTAPTSKLGKIDIVRILNQDDAWILLPLEARQQLYSLLPEPEQGDPPHDPDLHPLKTRYRDYIQNELRRWQNDLREGRESKKWREEAMRAGRDRAEGKYDEWKELQQREAWGRDEPPDENVAPVEGTLPTCNPHELATDLPATDGVTKEHLQDSIVPLLEHQALGDVEVESKR